MGTCLEPPRVQNSEGLCSLNAYWEVCNLCSSGTAMRQLAQRLPALRVWLQMPHVRWHSIQFDATSGDVEDIIERSLVSIYWSELPRCSALCSLPASTRVLSDFCPRPRPRCAGQDHSEGDRHLSQGSAHHPQGVSIAVQRNLEDNVAF